MSPAYRARLVAGAKADAIPVVTAVAASQQPPLSRMTRDELAALVVVLAEVAAHADPAILAAVAGADTHDGPDGESAWDLIAPDPAEDVGWEYRRNASAPTGPARTVVLWESPQLLARADGDDMDLLDAADQAGAA